MYKYLLVLVILLTSLYASVAVYVGKTATRDNKVHSDVILVPGAKAYRGKRYNLCMLARVEHAVALYKARYAKKLLFSGGIDKEDNANEAETMKSIAISLGVPANDILLETSSTSTWENLLFSKKILQAQGLHTVIIVTEPFHAPRTLLVAKKLGINASSSPAVKSRCWLRRGYFSRFFLKEPLAIIWYKMQQKW